MAVAGFCNACQRYVWLNENWGCVNGHGWDQIRNWYDPATGAAITPYWLRPAPAASAAQATPDPAPARDPGPEPSSPAAPAPAPPPAPAPASPASAALVPATRIDLLAEILATIGRYPGYRASYGTDTDITIDNQVVDATWSTGRRKIEYSAVLKAVEPEATVYFWEVLKEQGSGLGLGQLDSESYTTVGMKRSGKVKEVDLGPEGVVADAAWDYAATRQIVESVAAARGWRLKTVLRKSSAQWK